MSCNLCTIKKIRAHRTGMLDRALGLFHVYPYRCPECNSRFYSPGTPRDTAPRNPGLWRMLLVFGFAFLCCAFFIYMLIQERAPRGE